MYPVEDIYVTAAFGIKGSWAAGHHTGVDFRAAVGTPIFATFDGVVTHVGWGGYGQAYGLHVIVLSVYEGNSITHMYAHLSSTSVSEGQHVFAGDVVGKSGETGNTRGPHLHYEERQSPFGYYNHARPVLLESDVRPRPLAVVSDLSEDIIKRIQRRLNRRLQTGLKVTGEWDNATKRAYAKWQRRLGYTGADADGIPGETSLRRLGFRTKP